MCINIIILAAGRSSRMHSSLPKVLHPLGGKPLLQHVIETAKSLSPQHIYIVYGYQGEKIRSYFQYDDSLSWVEQKEQRGTAHAVMQVLPYLKHSEEKVLILYGDVPLISTQTLEKLIHQTSSVYQLGLLTVCVENPTGFGRIIRDADHKVIKIIEEKDADSTQKKINEVNPGIYLTTVKNLQTWLPQISDDNNQAEFYLTDSVKENMAIIDVTVENSMEVQGVNDREQLIILERYYQKQLARKLLLSGVTIMDPDRVDIRGEANIASDVIIDINVILEGKVEIQSSSKIGANCIIKNSFIGKEVEIRSHSIIEDATIGDRCKIGPFARLRPGTDLSAHVSIGNFVEIKKSSIGQHSKIPHLSYVGDTTMGEQVNIGAGTITCNYDGAYKHQTIIENNVFIGSDAQLVAPVKIAAGATIGAGSTITKNAPANKLTLSRAKQQTIEHWARPHKEEK